MLVIGYGNPGRGDDGLGPAFAAAVGAIGPPEVEVSVDYQLTVDHVLEIADRDRVLFVDADVSLTVPFALTPLAPSRCGNLTSHSLSPGDVLALSQTLYGTVPEAHVLGIAGERFDRIAEGLSPAAARNLDLAIGWFVEWTGAPAKNPSRA
ncbi:MAG: hydrogenase maturation protease [Paracoccaceae bacterium]|nr:hydrogenase maturation protease [Paracoccaceae bacterium]